VARWPISALLAAAVVLAGCGGGSRSPAERAVASTLEGYLGAFAHGDYAGACARLTDDAKERIARRSRAPTLGIQAGDCATQLRQIVKVIPPQQRGTVLGVVGDAKVGAVHISDGQATADVRANFHGQAKDQPVNLVLVAGTWKVDASPNPR
jgi:hypothetical protein